jgi:hypothetical protein
MEVTVQTAAAAAAAIRVSTRVSKDWEGVGKQLMHLILAAS